MRSNRARLLYFLGGAISLALPAAGCGSGPDLTYGVSRGASLNGTSVLVRLLKDRGHPVRAAIRLNEELADWAGGIVRFAPYPGPPDTNEAQLVSHLARGWPPALADLCRARL